MRDAAVVFITVRVVSNNHKPQNSHFAVEPQRTSRVKRALVRCQLWLNSRGRQQRCCAWTGCPGAGRGQRPGGGGNQRASAWKLESLLQRSALR